MKILKITISSDVFTYTYNSNAIHLIFIGLRIKDISLNNKKMHRWFSFDRIKFHFIEMSLQKMVIFSIWPELIDTMYKSVAQFFFI